MADFTIQLKDILGVDTPTDHDPTKIGLDGYPVYSEGHRHELNTKIVKRFWNREIAHETIDIFRFRMDTLMCEIMPYYNRLFATTFEFDPFETVNLTVDNEGNTTSHGSMAGEQHGTDTMEGEQHATDSVEGETTGSSTDTTTGSTHDETHNQEQSESESSQQSDSEAVAVASEYPQTRVVDGEHYATGSNESKSTSDTTSTATSDGSSTSTSDGTSDSTTESENQSTSSQHGQNRSTNTQSGENQSTSNQETDQTQNTLQQQVTQGFQGNKSELIQQYRDTIIGVDNQILAELEILFMGIWDTGGAYNRLENTYYPRNGFPYVY